MKTIAFLALVSASTHLFAQDCNTAQIKADTPSASFLDLENGTALDLRTGLVWSKCAMGQTYSGGSCTGEATNFATAYDALNAANRVKDDYFGQSGFRVPSIKELASIVERQCSSPSINLSVFPDTPSATFLSSTPYPESPDNSVLRAINFTSGEEFTPPVETLRHIRLVKVP